MLRSLLIVLCLTQIAAAEFVVRERLKEPKYVDANCIYGFDSTEQLGSLYPFIKIEGAFVEYDPKIKWYKFAHGGPRVFWLEYGGTDYCMPPKRMLAQSGRSKDGSRLEDAVRAVEMERWDAKIHMWVPAEPYEPPVIPPVPPSEDDEPGAVIRFKLK